MRTSKLDKQRIKDEYEGGDSQAVIAKRYGVTVGRISQILRELGVIADPSRYLHMQSRLPTSEIIAHYQGGKTMREIAEIYECTWQAVQSHLENANVPLRNRGIPRTHAMNERDAAILQQYHDGTDIGIIAQLHNLTKPRIYQILGSAGISFDTSTKNR